MVTAHADTRHMVLRFADRVNHDGGRSPDERSDIRVHRLRLPGYRFAHPGYMLECKA